MSARDRDVARLRVLELGQVVQALPANVRNSTLVALVGVVKLAVQDPATVEKLLAAYQALGVSRTQLEIFIQRPLEQMTVDDYHHLSRAGQAIRNRETDWREVTEGPRPGDDRELSDDELRLRLIEAEQEGML